jgi:hypothetical protein
MPSMPSMYVSVEEDGSETHSRQNQMLMVAREN